MSGEEKDAQIGKAVTEYQSAKVGLAHIEKKVAEIFRTYYEAGVSMDKSHGTIDPPSIKNGNLHIGRTFSQSVDLTKLLNAEELKQVVIERDEAKERLDNAKKSLTDLGITGIS